MIQPKKRKWLMQQGFGLVGTLIALAIAAIAIGGMMQLASRQSRQVIAAESTKQAAMELKMLRDAVVAFNSANSGAWANGLRREITVAELIAAGHLPASFATRYNIATAGTTPLGQTYAIVASKAAAGIPAVPTGTVRTVIFQRGAPLAGALERVMVANDATQIMGYQRRVAIAGNQDHRLVTGWIQSGTATAQGVGGAFVKDISAWLAAGGGTAAAHAAVVFIGFPDLGGDGGGGGPGGTLAVGDCIVAPARPAYIGAPNLIEDSCPGAYPINAGSWPHCRYDGGPVSVALPLIGTAVTLVTNETTTFDLTGSQCNAYANARYNSCIAPRPGDQALQAQCSAAYVSDQRDCVNRPTTSRTTSIQLNSGSIAGPHLCTRSQPQITYWNEIVTQTFEWQNPEARDQYCCKPPPQ